MNQHFEKAVKAYKEKDFEKAVEHFSNAIEISPNDAEIHYQRGITYFHLNKLSLALVDFDKAAELDPENPYRYSSRAYIRDACGDTEGAYKDYQVAIKLDPDDAIAHNNLGLIEEKLGYQADAKKRYTKADKLAEKFDYFPGQKQHDNFTDKFVKMGELEDEEQETQSKNSESSLFNEMWKAVATEKGRKEFWKFVKNGFKV
jgi:tetratricopeptide (TPR) repeat protein